MSIVTIMVRVAMAMSTITIMENRAQDSKGDEYLLVDTHYGARGEGANGTEFVDALFQLVLIRQLTYSLLYHIFTLSQSNIQECTSRFSKVERYLAPLRVSVDHSGSSLLR
jgi:hypothetical protein